MPLRSTLAETHRTARNSGGSRATCREIDDKHLCQQIKKCDVFHSETHSDIECWQPVGLTSVPLKQFEEEKGGKSAQKKSDGADWNHDQPQGKSAEALVSYVNGSRSHAIGMLVDRRVRPYNMKEGDAALYHASGTEQKVYINDDGIYMLANNNKSEEKDAKEKERYASLRHVELKKQEHEIKDDKQVKDHKHQGDKVHTEVRCTKGRIEFRAGDTVFGYFEVSSETWYFKGKIAQMEFSDKISEKVGSSEVEIKSSTIDVTSEDVSISKKTWIGQDSKGGKDGVKVVTMSGPAKKAWAIPE
jgi:phage gp45-like